MAGDTITLEELQYMGVGWQGLTDEQRVAALEDRLARAAWGVINLTADQIRATQVLLNKYRGDRKSVELGGKDGQPLVLKLVVSEADVAI